jgi:hypothetical protein
MRRSALLTAPALALALVTGPLAPAAVAAPPAQYSGELQLVGYEFGEIRNTGGVNHFEFFSRTALTGDYEGQSENDLTCVGYELPFQRSFTCHGTSFTAGTLSEELGGGEFTTTSRISFRCSFVTGRCTGRSITYEGTGALAETRGVTTFEQNAFTGTGSWTAKVVKG